MFTQKVSSLTAVDNTLKSVNNQNKNLAQSNISFKAYSADSFSRIKISPFRKFMSRFFGGFPRLHSAREVGDLIKKANTTNSKVGLVSEIGTANAVRARVLTSARSLSVAKEAKKAPVPCTVVTPKVMKNARRFKSFRDRVR